MNGSSAKKWSALLAAGILLCLLLGYYGANNTSSAVSFFKQHIIQIEARNPQRRSKASDVWEEYTDIITKIDELSSTQCNCKQSDGIQRLLRDLVDILSLPPYSLPEVTLSEVKKTIPTQDNKESPSKSAIPENVAGKAILSRITNVNGDVCPEPYAYKSMREVDDNCYTGFNMVKCTGVPAFKTLLTMVYNFVNYSTEDLPHIPRLLNSVNRVYPGIAIVAALPSDSELTADKFNHTTFTKYKRNMAETDVWNQMIAKVKTKYVYIGRNVIHFMWFDRLERLVREVNNLGAYAVGASYRTLRSGRWKAGCQQTTLNNYTLTYKHGYRMSIHECMICDDIEGPFVSKTQLFKEVPLKRSVTATSGFAMWFLTLKKTRKGVTAASCPDAMSFVTDNSELPTDKSRWIHLAKSLQVERVHPPVGPMLEFGCTEAGTQCSRSRRKGMALSNCCGRQLSKAIKLVMKLCLEHGFLCELNAGTIMGAVKFRGILPWELDADIKIAGKSIDDFAKVRSAVAKQGHTMPKYKNRRNIKYYEMMGNGWKVDIYAHKSLDSVMLAKQGINQTVIEFDGLYVATPASPALYIRNQYGVGNLRHVQHWSQKDKSISSLYTLGKFTRCPKPGHHACLDQYATDGSFQFLWPGYL